MDPWILIKVVFQDILVSSPIHSGVLGKKESSTMPNSSRKATPDHHRVTMFDSFHCVLAVIPVGPGGPCDLGADGPEVPEGGLISVHYHRPVFGCPVLVGFAEDQPLLFHPQQGESSGLHIC